MADRGNQNRGRGQGQFQQQPLPNRGGGGGNRRGAQHGDSGRGNHGNQGGGSARGPFQGGRGRGRGQGQDNARIFKQEDKVPGLSSTAKQLEDDTIQQSLASDIQQLSLKDQTGIPKRPAYGSKGRKIVLWANYFKLLPSRTSTFNRYDVSMLEQTKNGENNEEPKGKKLERCMQLLLQQLPNTVPIATDYRKTLITPPKLPFSQREFMINYYSESENGPGTNSPRYRAKVQFTGTLKFGDILDYLSSTDLNRDSPSDKEEIIQAMNIIIASGMKSDQKIITKKNKFFPTEGNLMEQWVLATGLKAFRGLFMSVRAATGRILLNVQVQHVATWETQPMVDLLRKLIQVDKESWLDVHNMIAGVTVKATHLGHKLKRVAGFVQQGDGFGSTRPPQIKQPYANADQVRFWKEQPVPGRWITVARHFAETYRPLNLPQAPLLNVGTRSSPIYMPSEMCIIKEYQTYDKKLSPKATDQMIKFAVRHPADNAKTVVDKGIGLLQANSRSTLDAFHIDVDPLMITVTGRILDATTIEYRNKKTIRPEDASWNMLGARFNLAGKSPVWTYLWIRIGVISKDKNGNESKSWRAGDFTDQKQVDTVVDDFYNTWKDCGCNVNARNAPYTLTLTNANDPSREIDNKFAEIASKVEALLVILPSKSTAIYNAVKRAGDIKYGVHTVNVVADRRKFCQGLFRDHNGPGHPNGQYHANVALKFNLKLGGRNQVLRDIDRGFIREGKTMLVGLDVTHPAPGSAQTAPSISSITASIDSHLSQWPADVAIQSRSKEMIEGLKNMFKSRLVLWRKHQPHYPEEIIIYRDGVGDSMYELVRSQELPLIREACSELYPPADTKACKPYITIIICGKRHHTRFYPTDTNDLDRRTGCTKSGTVVDRGITETRFWDFYLQAHTALQGTPRSAHYVVIHDEVFRRRAAMEKVKDGSTVGQRAADEVERLTHAMCYTFGRATKAVSLCPPAYYADIVCERARVWLSGIFDERNLASAQAEARDTDVRVHPKLRDTMFYM